MVEKLHDIVHFENLHAHFEKCLCCSVTTPDFLFTTPYKKLSTTVCLDEDVKITAEFHGSESEERTHPQQLP